MLLGDKNMKKIMMVGSSLLILSTSSVFASQARLNALGMMELDNEGMYNVQDSRNVFLNPAFINLYPNQVMVDWGDTGKQISAAGSTSSATTNDPAAPKAQGGIFKKSGDYVYGVYLGNESNTSSFLRVAGTSAAAAMNGSGASSKMLQTADNQLDVFMGGEKDGMKWGANAVYTAGKDETRSSTDSAESVRLGVISSNWDAHLNVSLNSKSSATDTLTGGYAGTTTQEFKGKIGVQIGGSHEAGAHGRVFGYYKHYGWDQSDSFAYSAAQSAAIGGQTGTVSGDFTTYFFGFANDYSVGAGDKVFASIAGKKTDINLEFSNKTQVRHLIVPVTLGYEAKATEWLVLRGSIVQNIYGQYDNQNVNNYASTGTRVNKVASSLLAAIYGGSGKATVANSTTVNAGATLTFGQLAIDGLIGTTDTTGNASSSTKSYKLGVLSLNNVMTSVGATYKF